MDLYSPTLAHGKGMNPIPSPLSLTNQAPLRHPSTPAPLLSTAEAVATMLTSIHRDHHDHEGVTTVRLPRGNVSVASQSRSGSTGESASSISLDSRTGLHVMHDVGVLELLEQDRRPTFVVDLVSRPRSSGLHVLYKNPALRQSPSIAGLVSIGQADPTAPSASPEFMAFKAWVMHLSRGSDSNLASLGGRSMLTHVYGGVTWTHSTLRRRFRVVCADLFVRSPTTAPSSKLARYAGKEAGTSVDLGKNVARIEEEAESEIDAIADAIIGADVGVEIGIDVDIDVAGVSPGIDEIDAEISAEPEGLIEAMTPDDVPDYFGSIDKTLGMAPGVFPINEYDDDDGGSSRTHSDEFTRQVFRSQPSISSFDWTRIPLTAPMDDHIRFARDVDWAATPLGPIEDWPSDLRVMSNLIMGSPHPAVLYWGPEHTAIYNAAYIDMAGGKHPMFMGANYQDAWPEIWDAIEPVFRSAREHGQATMKQESQLFIMRNGFLEEAFFSWSIVPILDADGQVVGIYNPSFEHTRRKISERWMLLLREVGERTAMARHVSNFWPQVQKGLDFNEFDVPFALIYSVKDGGESDVSSLHSGSHMVAPQLVLEGSLGVPEGHRAAPAMVDLRDGVEGFAPFMRQCMVGRGSPMVLDRASGTLPEELVEGIRWRGFGDAPSTVVVIPVVPSGVAETVVGFIVMGTNPRRPYDDDYKLFVSLLSRQLTTSMAAVVLFEEEVKRSRRAERLAAMDRQELSLQLRLKTQQALESEHRFTRMAQFSPVGMFIADPRGSITYCNDMWWRISHHDRTLGSADGWMNSVMDEDQPKLAAVWRRLLDHKVAVTHEFRFKHGRKRGDHTLDTWALMSAYPEKDDSGALKLIFGCITEISSQKWAEHFQKQRKEEAVEMKRQQENFIDITSHEMRNPLSAVLQCADEITNTISDFRKRKLDPEARTATTGTAATTASDGLKELLDACDDAAHTINLCASHQKRIVDDILTLSKLDTKLLTVCPVDAQPVSVLERVFRMFEPELSTHDIELRFETDESYVRHAVEWVKLDPSRLQQVLINLMTNAIKFTQNCDVRSITVTLGASTDVSDIAHTYIPTGHRDRSNPTADELWGSGEVINIHFSVTDTGTGLGEDEMKLLFQRFSQTSPRTHVQYDGSGLGLFISRILTEMQGGQIGVHSTKGVGSTFRFYIKARRAGPPLPMLDALAGTGNENGVRTPPPTAEGLARPMIKTVKSSSHKQQAATTVRIIPPLPSALTLDVLIVEDNIVNQKVLQKQLRNRGHNTHVANHGGEALETLQQSRFWTGRQADGIVVHVVLMDLEMPVMDGMTCVRRIRELQREGVIVRHIPIIAVTAYARPEQIADAKAAGIDDVISKPFRIPDLMPKIQELVAKHGTRSLSIPAQEAITMVPVPLVPESAVVSPSA